jgi:hypothetical protein
VENSPASDKRIFILGSIMAASFLALVPLPSLRGPYVFSFLTFYIFSAVAYSFTIFYLRQTSLSLKIIWGFAVVFRLIMLLTTPSLSDDVYRYIWDGHLINAGVNPYSFSVNSAMLDIYTTPLRDLVNNNWMASPYLPSSQLTFAIVEYLFPQQAWGFQLTTIIFDLTIGWLILDILRRLGFHDKRVLIYLWNPLVILEFSHSAHIVDALMILLVLLTFWLLIRNWPKTTWGAPISLAAATLTKALPVLLLPIFFRRFGWKKLIIYVVILVSISTFVAADPGWGLSGDQDGTGLFGAIQIYMSWWNYNSSIFHWLEVGISGYQTPGGVPVELVGEAPGQLARIITTGSLGLICLATMWISWKIDKLDSVDRPNKFLALLRLATLPIGAYLLLTHTVHPWYAIFILPFLVFLFPQKEESHQYGWFSIAWLYFTLALPFSYLTYLNPSNFREFTVVRWIEYFPLYFFLALAIIVNYRKKKESADKSYLDD